MTLYQFFQKQVKDFGPRLAVAMRPRYRTIYWTYRTLGEKTANLSWLLTQQGIKKGDRVLLFSPNSPYWIAAFFAILSRGAIVVPLNPQSPPEQLARITDACKPKLLLKTARLPWSAPKLPSLDMERADEMMSLNSSIAAALNLPTDIAEIVYTSGTTGEPKGVVLTHKNILSNLDALSQLVPIKPSGHVVSIVPLFHMYGQITGMLYPLRHGAAVTYASSLSSRAIREIFVYTPATHLVVVPEFLNTAMDRIESQLPRWGRSLLLPFSRRKISSTLHTIACGGAPLDPRIELKWRRIGFTVLQGYGLTETSPVISTNTYKEHRLSSVGKPLPGVEVKIASDGEILIRGENVMSGYYRDEKRTKESFENLWLKTDDIGRIDQDGFLYVLGRKKYLILGSAGEHVFPEDIEAELNKIPGVKDSAVVGLEKDDRVSIYAVLLCDQCDGDAIIIEANKHLAPHQQIMGWSLWPEADFPRSATRKIRKEDVIRWLKSQKEELVKPLTRGVVTPLVRLLAEVTGRNPHNIQATTRIVPELHLDSLFRIELVSRIEEEFNVSLEERTITPKIAVSELEDLVVKSKKWPPVLTKYPRWSLLALSRALRLILQKLLFFSWLPLIVKLRVKGLENLAELRGTAIFMANHKSFIDSLVVLKALPRFFRQRLGIAAATGTLYKKYWWFAPLADLIFNSYPFPTEIQENIKPGFDYTGRLLDNGWNVLIYPEGQMNQTKTTLLPLKDGAGLLATEMRVPVVPVTVIGAEKILPPGKIFPRRRGAVEIRFGKPLYFKSTEPYPEAVQKIEKAMKELLS